MHITPLREDLDRYLKEHQLQNKFGKAVKIFRQDPLHPSLHTELLEPRKHLVYSFRLDRKYRVLFIYIEKQTIEIIAITNHYK